jgi:hypothetical protein
MMGWRLGDSERWDPNMREGERECVCVWDGEIVVPKDLIGAWRREAGGRHSH